MRPLTLATPKHLLPMLGKPLLAHTIDSLPQEITELLIVTDYLREQIESYFGSSWHGRSVRYVRQPQKLGTYRALELCKDQLADDFFLVLYEDLFGPKTYSDLVGAGRTAIVVAEVADPRRFGVVALREDGTVLEIEEKPEHPKTNLANAGPNLLTKAIFDYPPPKHRNGEYVLAESVSLFARTNPVYVVQADWWIPIGYPEDLKKAEAFLKEMKL